MRSKEVAPSRDTREKALRKSRCGHPITVLDLDGKCQRCRGHELALYPKTEAVKARDLRWVEKSHKQDWDSEQLRSDYFWYCQYCGYELGPGYQGPPDESGCCAACARTIAAAGGVEALHRKKLERKLLTVLDGAALFAFYFPCVIAAACIAIFIIGTSAIAGWKELQSTWNRSYGWSGDYQAMIIIIVVAVAGAWCRIRRKALDAKTLPNKDKEIARIRRRVRDTR